MLKLLGFSHGLIREEQKRALAEAGALKATYGLFRRWFRGQAIQSFGVYSRFTVGANIFQFIDNFCSILFVRFLVWLSVLRRRHCWRTDVRTLCSSIGINFEFQEYKYQFVSEDTHFVCLKRLQEHQSASSALLEQALKALNEWIRCVGIVVTLFVFFLLCVVHGVDNVKIREKHETSRHFGRKFKINKFSFYNQNPRKWVFFSVLCSRSLFVFILDLKDEKAFQRGDRSKVS